MNKYILSIVFTLLLVKHSSAQMHISTSMRSDYSWSSIKEEWILISDDENEKTFFDFNKDFTLMKHTTSSITSTYIIKSYNEDKPKKQWEFAITSDVGNDYVMILDLKNNNVRFIGKSKGELFLVKHLIKKVWFDN